MRLFPILASTAAALLLAGCVQSPANDLGPTTAVVIQTPQETMVGYVTPEERCTAAMAVRSGGQDVSVVGSELMYRGVAVLLRVGPQNTAWRCVALNDGSFGPIVPVPPSEYL